MKRSEVSATFFRASPARRRVAARLACLAVIPLALSQGAAQVPGRNVNLVSGVEWPGGDPFLNRQNEPFVAASSRNVLHLMAGANDYRTVDIAGVASDRPTQDAWVGLFKSFDGGQTWQSTLVPGYPQDTSAAGLGLAAEGLRGRG